MFTYVAQTDTLSVFQDWAHRINLCDIKMNYQYIYKKERFITQYSRLIYHQHIILLISVMVANNY